MNPKQKFQWTPAVIIILIFGIISLMGDMVYESARSANSQYFNLLHVSAAQVGLVFGLGEFLGYFLRLLAGIFSDKSGRHWVFIFVGYGLLLAVPLVGLTTHWPVLVIFVMMERIGKALRSPAKDTVLSAVAEHQVGIGIAFGVQEALDQIGAFLGPLIFTLIFYVTGKSGLGQYQTGYQSLVIPYVLLMLFLIYAFRRIKRGRLLPDVIRKERSTEQLKPIFWMYTAFTFFTTVGFVNFSIIGYHLKDRNLLTDGRITMLYAIAMAVDAAMALVTGSLYDRLKKWTGFKSGGMLILLATPLLTILLPIFSLGDRVGLIVIGMVLFGMILGTHETVMRSAIADMTPFDKRGTGYGLFNTSYGLALLAGSALMGLLYDRSQLGLIMTFAVIAEAVAILIYVRMWRIVKKDISR